MATVSEQLRKAIDTSGVSRYRLWKLTGIPQSRLSRFMSGGKLTMDQVDAVCKVLGLTLTQGKARKGK
jgi:predicted XRE-type DNA-binding protein